ncbi:MAG: FAD-binding oxidoreductase [Pseudomonadota bacterium]
MTETLLPSDPALLSRPFWWNAAPPDDTPAPALEAACDIAIVGAGYTGLAAALVLARAGRSVQVFDRQRPGEGASTRNGGITSGSLRIGLKRMIETQGEARALTVHGEGVRARADLYRFIEEEAIECDLQRAGRFTGATNPQALEAQAREAEALNRHFDLGATMLSRTEAHNEVASDLYQGGMLRPDIGHLHPGKLHRGLLARARAAGVRVLGQTPVERIAREGAGFSLTTTAGALRAGQVLMATNGYTDGVSAWLCRRLVPVTSRIVVTEELSPNLMGALIPKGRAVGETRKLYRYYRPSPDGKRLVIGARERAFTRDPARNAEHLRQGLAGIFPELAKVGIAQSWNGYVAFSRDMVPRLFEHDGVLHACGFCGSGVVWARWLGERAAYRMLGQAEAAATAFFGPPPAAVPLYDGRPWFLPFAVAAYALQDRGVLGSRNRRA